MTIELADDANRPLSPAEAVILFFTRDEWHTVTMLHACIDYWNRVGRMDRGESMEGWTESTFEARAAFTVRIGAVPLVGVPAPLVVPASDLLLALARARADFP